MSSIHMSNDFDATSIQDAIEVMQYCTRKYCVHPRSSSGDCGGKIIRAHTIQRNGGLTRIAREGHVYQYDLGIDRMIQPEFQPTLKLVGISRATTFTGFCQKHDTEVFRPIEAYDFLSTPEQCFLLAYRAISRETYTKRIQKEIIPYQREAMKRRSSSVEKTDRAFWDSYEDGVTLGLRDTEYYKNILDGILLSANYNQVKYYTVMLDRPPELLVSGGFFFECDFEGNVLQDPEEFSNASAILHFTTFSLIATDSGGAAVFSWVGDNDMATRFIASLARVSDEQIGNAIVRLAVEHFENIAFSPQWYNSLGVEDRRNLLERVRINLSSEEHRANSYLMDDGRRFVDWQVVSRMGNTASDSAYS